MFWDLDGPTYRAMAKRITDAVEAQEAAEHKASGKKPDTTLAAMAAAVNQQNPGG